MREAKLLLLYLWIGEPTFRAELRAADEIGSRLFDDPRSLCDHLERIARPAGGWPPSPDAEGPARRRRP